MTKNQNAFETTLTAQYGASDLVANVVELGTLTSPCYVVIEPDSDTQREVIYFDGVFGATSFVTSTTNNRYLPGSAAPSGLTHPAGATVRSVILAQHLDDLDARIDTLDHSDLLGLTSGDPHTQYVLGTDHVASGAHDALGINAGELGGLTLTELRDEFNSGMVGHVYNDQIAWGNCGSSFNQQGNSGAITIPASWNTYTLIATCVKQFGTGAANTIYSKLLFGADYSLEHRFQNYNAGAQQTVTGHWTGRTATGAQTVLLYSRTDTSDITTFAAAWQLMAFRTS